MNSEALKSGDGGPGERTPAQVAAMQKVNELADEIVRDHPEVADDYRAGLNQPEIAFKYSLQNVVGIRIARMAVGKALKTLIPDKEERQRLGKERNVESASITPKNLSPEGLSVLRQSMHRCLAEIGKIPWVTNLVDKVLHLNEPDYLIHLAEDPEYIIQAGKRKGHPNCFRIADKLNEVFHRGNQVRSAKAVSTQLARLSGRQQ